MAEEIVLKPCPFCGEAPHSFDSGCGGLSPYIIVCGEASDCPAAPIVSGKTEEAAAKRWNTRAPTPLAELTVVASEERKALRAYGDAFAARREPASDWVTQRPGLLLAHRIAVRHLTDVARRLLPPAQPTGKDNPQ